MEAEPRLPDDVPTLQQMVRDLQQQNHHLQTQLHESHTRIQQLQTENQQLRTIIEELRSEVASLKAQLAEQKKDRFGKKSERTKRPPREKSTKPKHKHGRTPLPAHLERRDTILDLTDEEKLCRCCGEARVCIGQAEAEQLDCEPRTFFVRRTIRKTYACQKCDIDVPADQRIETAKPPTVGPIDKGLCGPGLLADVIISKFLDHQPLHRQVGILVRSGVTIAESTLGDWVKQAAILASPLAQLMRKLVLTCPAIWSDDTRSRFAQPGHSTMPKGHFWVAIGDATAPYTIFHFSKNYEAATGPDVMLKGYEGYLHADCLSQYNTIFEKAKHVACFAHARRKFLNAGDVGKVPFEFIQKLYRIENNLPPPDTPEHIAQRKALRQTQALPILAELKAWCDAALPKLLPKEPLSLAIRYVTGRWDAFVRYTEDGRLSIDNNLSERTLRQIALGRANWKFVGSAEAGKRAAVLYTLMGTCRHLKLDAFAYLRDVLPALHALGEKPTEDQLQPLLPDAWAKRQPAAAKAA